MNIINYFKHFLVFELVLSEFLLVKLEKGSKGVRDVRSLRQSQFRAASWRQLESAILNRGARSDVPSIIFNPQTGMSVSGSCRGTFHENEITSPNFPSPYSNNMDCQWTIQPPSDSRIELNFAAFELESDSNCRYDWLKVHDGRDESSPIIGGGRMCGKNIPENIVSNGNILHLIFKSDSSVPEKGFKIHYYKIAKETSLSGSCPGTYNEAENKIDSPNFPRNYGNNNDCEWNIQVPVGKRIQLRFTTFDLESESNCGYDWLNVYDGGGSSAQSIQGRMCGNNRPSNILSSGNRLHLRFKSDMSVPKTGFQIYYEMKDEDTEGSGDVCNVEGSTCPDPDNTCCRDEQCQKEGGHSKCCSDPSSENNCSPCSVCVDCLWSEWNTQAINGYPRVCNTLDCKGDGSSPETAIGQKTRRVLVEPGPGGKPCSPNGERSLEECRGDCPGILNYIIRVLFGIAAAGAWGSVITIVMEFFPNNVSKLTAAAEFFFGLGFLLGPYIGTVMYNMKGFIFPFEVVGLMGVLVAFVAIIIVPDVHHENEKKSNDSTLTFTKLFQSPAMLVPLIDGFTAYFGFGMIDAMLEPHLRSVGANITEVGVVFLISAGAYFLGAFCSGIILDRIPYPTIVSIFGNVGLILGFTFIGPLPFISNHITLPIASVCAASVSCSVGMLLSSTLIRAQKATVEQGYSEDTENYHIISGMWTSSIYFGTFLGPTIGGVAVETWDFRTATIIYWCTFIIVLIFNIIELCFKLRKNISGERNKYDEITSENKELNVSINK